MQSPVLSRTPSSSAFAPGPHRRSHPNLQNLGTLSLAPLTPKYPIDPADYDAYFNPGTSELHTSASLSQIATLPSPGGILTNSPARSRDPSRTRKQRRIKSHVHIREPEQDQLYKSLSEPNNEPTIADQRPPPPQQHTKPNKSQLRLSKIRTTIPDPSWLVQTGLSLTESSRETKGQSWLSKRDSSTSLAATPSDYFTINDRTREGRTPRSGRNTPATAAARSRVSSRNASRTRLMDLRMTTSGATSPVTERDRSGMKSASFVTAAELELDDQIEEEDEDLDIQPNWADAKTQAELAAQLQEELGEDFDDDGDPYGMLNFEEQGSDDGDSDADEEEVRRAMSRYRLGGWMGLDGAIDALLRVEEVNDNSQLDIEQGVEELSKRDSAEDVETPPQTSSGSWVDVNWFGRLFGRSAGA